MGRLWDSRPARILILLGALLSIGLLVWVSLVIPELEQVSLGVTATGAPRSPLPGIQLILLPVFNLITYLINLFLGMVFFRRTENQNLAYLLWGTSIFVSILFLVAVFFIL